MVIWQLSCTHLLIWKTECHIYLLLSVLIVLRHMDKAENYSLSCRKRKTKTHTPAYILGMCMCSTIQKSEPEDKEYIYVYYMCMLNREKCFSVERKLRQCWGGLFAYKSKVVAITKATKGIFGVLLCSGQITLNISLVKQIWPFL